MKEKAGGGSMALLQIYCLFVENQVEERGSGTRRKQQTWPSFIVVQVRESRNEAGEAGCERGRLLIQRKIDGKKSDEDKEEGIALQWAVCCSKSKYKEGGKHNISALKNRDESTDIK